MFGELLGFLSGLEKLCWLPLMIIYASLNVAFVNVYEFFVFRAVIAMLLKFG